MHYGVIASLLGILTLISPAQAKTTFIKPPAAGEVNDYDINPRYENGEPIDIIFETDLDIFDIAAVQDYPFWNGTHGHYWQTILDDTDRTTLSWTPDATDWATDGDQDLVLFILVSKQVSDGLSHYFNVTAPRRRSPSSGSSSSSASNTVSISAATSTSSSPDASESSAQGDENATNGEPISSSGLSTGAKAGIGVGVAAGLLGIIAAVVVFMRMRRKKAAGAQVQEKTQEKTQEPQVQELAGSALPVFEMEGDYAPRAYKDSTSPPAR